MLKRGQLGEFAERGFVLLRQVVPPEVVSSAARVVDELMEREPPGTDVRGPFNYFRQAAEVPAVAALLAGSPAFGLAESLAGAGTLEVPGQVQVALNIRRSRTGPGCTTSTASRPKRAGGPGRSPCWPGC